MTNGLYNLTRKGLTKIHNPVPKLLFILTLSHVVFLALGYAWRMKQVLP